MMGMPALYTDDNFKNFLTSEIIQDFRILLGFQKSSTDNFKKIIYIYKTV